MDAITRRSLLQAFLGGTVAAMSGCRAEVNALPPGKIVGANHEMGHRLRQLDVASLLADDSKAEPLDVLIVGGGMAGLSAGRRLLEHGVTNFKLLDLEQEIGGTSRSGVHGTERFPWGAHYVPAPTTTNPDLVRLFSEMKVLDGEDEHGQPLVAEPFCCRYPEERIFYKGHWYEGLYLRSGASARDLEEFTRFQETVRAPGAMARRPGAPGFHVADGQQYNGRGNFVSGQDADDRLVAMRGLQIVAFVLVRRLRLPG